MNVFSSTHQPKKPKRSHFAGAAASDSILKLQDYHRIIERSRFNNKLFDHSSQEIAKLLSNGFFNENYDRIIIENVVEGNLEDLLGKFRLLDDSHYEKINFGSTSDGLRMQKRIDPPDELQTLFDALHLFLNDHVSKSTDASSLKDSLIWKVLKSNKGCKRQDLHIDAPEMQGEISAQNMRYSIIVSIMPGTKIVLHDHSVEDIPLRGMIMFRGNYLHAGAEYDEVHYRLFIACYSIQFKPLDIDIVGLQLKDAAEKK